MTVKAAKLEIARILEELDADGIRVLGIGVNWSATATLTSAKPDAIIKCSIELEAKL